MILQELTEYGKADAPALDVLTFLQQPVERIQTYQTLLKVSKGSIALDLCVKP